MYCFHIGAAELRDSAFGLNRLPSVFPAHTIVVICGLYHAVQRSRGYFFPVFVFPSAVPVFAATFFPLIVRAFLQYDDSGRAELSDSILLIIYDAAGENAISHSVFLCSSIIVPSVVSIFSIKYRSFFVHIFASTLYACISSIGFTSHAPRAMEPPYACSFSSWSVVTHIFRIFFTISSCCPARKYIFIAGIFRE